MAPQILDDGCGHGKKDGRKKKEKGRMRGKQGKRKMEGEKEGKAGEKEWKVKGRGREIDRGRKRTGSVDMTESSNFLSDNANSECCNFQMEET